MTNQLEELQKKCFKLHFVLGVAMGQLTDFLHICDIPSSQKRMLEGLHQYVMTQADLFFEDEPIKKNTEIYTKEWQERCKVCNKYHVGSMQCVASSGIWPPNCS